MEGAIRAKVVHKRQYVEFGLLGYHDTGKAAHVYYVGGICRIPFLREVCFYGLAGGQIYVGSTIGPGT